METGNAGVGGGGACFAGLHPVNEVDWVFSQETVGVGVKFV